MIYCCSKLRWLCNLIVLYLNLLDYQVIQKLLHLTVNNRKTDDKEKLAEIEKTKTELNDKLKVIEVYRKEEEGIVETEPENLKTDDFYINHGSKAGRI